MEGSAFSGFLNILGSRVSGILAGGQHPGNGFWGPPSATVDWCEQNYVFSHYIAEFFNTISSFAMVIVGLLGIWLHLGKFEPRLLLSFGSVAIVGLGSAAFHGTLLFALQMCDELPMIYSALIMTYAVLEHQNIRPKYRFLPIILIAHAIITTFLVASPASIPKYGGLLQFVAFHISFATLELFLLIRTTQLYFSETDLVCRRMHVTGLGLWVAGLTCWILDYLLCDSLFEGENSMRVKYFSLTLNPESWQWLSLGTNPITLTLPNPQLHAWWHICASAGLYCMSVVLAHSRAKVLGHKPKVAFFLRIFPYVSLVDHSNKKMESSEKKVKSGGKEKKPVLDKESASTMSVSSPSSTPTKRRKSNARTSAR